MFGLMRARGRAHTQIAPRFRRLHYCGTCKTMGQLYGQKSRTLLNHDTVFLAELLSLLAGEDKQLGTWARAYQSYNCFSLPKSEAEMPLPLQYAATATLLLTEYKLRDHIEDSHNKRPHWRWLQRLLSPSFRAAVARLQSWNFPLAELEHALGQQSAREQTVSAKNANPADALAYLAEPTATATALFFEHGAALVGSTPQESETMRRLGHLLGTIAYVVDAWQDRERDEQRHEFNALIAIAPTADHRKLVEQSVSSAVAEMSSLLTQLPLSPEAARVYVAQLRANLAPELPASLRILSTHSKPAHKSRSWKDRWREARELGDAGRREWLEEHGHRWAGPVFAAVTVLALVSPHQVREAHSVRDCLGLGTNLMFWGSAAMPLALCGPSRRQVYVDEYGRPIQVRRAGPSCCHECCCCCEICSCECCACETCACEECCNNCCSCN